MGWVHFLQLRGEVLAAAAFFTVKVATWYGLVPYYVLVVMELATRCAHVVDDNPGGGGYLLVGTPEQIVDRLMRLTAMGLDGVVLSGVNYEAELAYWISDVLPVMEQEGLCRPYVPAHARA